MFQVRGNASLPTYPSRPNLEADLTHQPQSVQSPAIQQQQQPQQQQQGLAVDR